MLLLYKSLQCKSLINRARFTEMTFHTFTKLKFDTFPSYQRPLFILTFISWLVVQL